jgi:hypothetical protein
MQRFGLAALLVAKNPQSMQDFEMVRLRGENFFVKGPGLVQLSLLMQLDCALQRLMQTREPFPQSPSHPVVRNL